MLRRPRPCVSVGAFAQVLSGFVLVSHIAQVAVDTITLSLPPCIHTIILPLIVILDPRPIVYHAHSLLQISISLLGIFCNGDIKFCSLIQLTMLQLTLSSCFLCVLMSNVPYVWIDWTRRKCLGYPAQPSRLMCPSVCRLCEDV
jgi:hypothetical protein